MCHDLQKTRHSINKFVAQKAQSSSPNASVLAQKEKFTGTSSQKKGKTLIFPKKKSARGSSGGTKESNSPSIEEQRKICSRASQIIPAEFHTNQLKRKNASNSLEKNKRPKSNEPIQPKIINQKNPKNFYQRKAGSFPLSIYEPKLLIQKDIKAKPKEKGFICGKKLLNSGSSKRITSSQPKAIDTKYRTKNIASISVKNTPRSIKSESMPFHTVRGSNSPKLISQQKVTKNTARQAYEQALNKTKVKAHFN